MRYQGCPQDVNSQDWDETETVDLQDRDVPKDVSRPQCRSLKTLIIIIIIIIGYTIYNAPITN